MACERVLGGAGVVAGGRALEEGERRELPAVFDQRQAGLDRRHRFAQRESDFRARGFLGAGRGRRHRVVVKVGRRRGGGRDERAAAGQRGGRGRLGLEGVGHAGAQALREPGEEPGGLASATDRAAGHAHGTVAGGAPLAPGQTEPEQHEDEGEDGGARAAPRGRRAGQAGRCP